MRGHDWINAYLPDEVIVKIFRHLESKWCHEACSLVCKHWLELERLSRTTLHLNFRDSSIDDHHFEKLARGFANVNYISINDPWRKDGSSSDPMPCLSDARLTVLAECFPKLENLSLYRCKNVSISGLMSLAYKCIIIEIFVFGGNILEKISTEILYLCNTLSLLCVFRDCQFEDHGLAVMGQFCNQLEDLNLHGCEGLTDTGLLDLVLGCGKSLKSICVSGCEKITDVLLEAMSYHCKLLETLSLGPGSFHNKGLLALVQGCPLIKDLSLCCISITDETLIAVGSRCFSLRKFDLFRTELVTDRGMEAVAAGCKELTDLSVYICRNISTIGLESIARSCRHLTQLHLCLFQSPPIGNATLFEVGRGCKFLRVLRLDYCSSIDNDAICSIAKGCRWLKELEIVQCDKIGNKGMVAVGEYCKGSLQRLVLRHCREIGDSGLIAIARGCPQLNHLTVSHLSNVGNMTLVELGEGCPLLNCISLSGCPQITDVGLAHLVKNCKVLEYIYMKGCEGITECGVATVVSSCANIQGIGVEASKVSQRTKRMAGKNQRNIFQ